MINIKKNSQEDYRTGMERNSHLTSCERFWAIILRRCAVQIRDSVSISGKPKGHGSFVRTLVKASNIASKFSHVHHKMALPSAMLTAAHPRLLFPKDHTCDGCWNYTTMFHAVIYYTIIHHTIIYYTYTNIYHAIMDTQLWVLGTSGEGLASALLLAALKGEVGSYSSA